MKKPKQYDDDDGRTIANMDVDGMPWYLRRGARRSQSDASGKQEPLELDRGERWALFKGVISAALLIFLVFAGFFFLLILFIDKVLFT